MHLFSRAANKSLLWYKRPRLQGGRCPPRRRRGAQLTSAAKDAAGVGHASLSRSAAQTAGRSPTCSRNIYLRTFGAAKYEALSAHKIKLDRRVGGPRR